jgi:hypothetical protein
MAPVRLRSAARLLRIRICQLTESVDEWRNVDHRAHKISVTSLLLRAERRELSPTLAAPADGAEDALWRNTRIQNQPAASLSEGCAVVSVGGVGRGSNLFNARAGEDVLRSAVVEAIEPVISDDAVFIPLAGEARVRHGGLPHIGRSLDELVTRWSAVLIAAVDQSIAAASTAINARSA